MNIFCVCVQEREKECERESERLVVSRHRSSTKLLLNYNLKSCNRFFVGHKDCLQHPNRYIICHFAFFSRMRFRSSVLCLIVFNDVRLRCSSTEEWMHQRTTIYIEQSDVSICLHEWMSKWLAAGLNGNRRWDTIVCNCAREHQVSQVKCHLHIHRQREQHQQK